MGGIIAIIAGVVLLGMGAFFTRVGRQSGQHVKHLDTLSRLDPNAEGWPAHPREGWIEGKVSGLNAPLSEGMVAYIRYAFRGWSTRSQSSPNGDETVKEPIWDEDMRRFPPLILDAQGADVLIHAQRATIKGAHTHVSPGALEKDRSLKLEGFRIGDAVVAIGAPGGSPDEPTIEANTLWTGTFAQYRQEQASGSKIALIIGLVLLAVGVITASVGGLVLAS